NLAFACHVHRATHGASASERRLSMARRRRHQGDPIHDFQEWQNHQYDPGYMFKLTRLRLFTGGRGSSARYPLIFLGMFSLVILVLSLFRWDGHIAPLVILIGGIMLITVVLLINLTRLRRTQERRSRRRRKG